MSKTKKDLLIMCQYFYPEKITSALLPFMTAKYLSKNGITVDVLTGTPSNYLKHSNYRVPQSETVEGVRIRRLNYLKLSKKNVLSRLVNYFSIVIAFLLKLPTMRQYKVIMVYSNPPILPLISVFAKKLFNNKLVFVSYDVYPEIAIRTEVISDNSIIARVMKIVNKFVFSSADKVVALSSEMKKFLVENRPISTEKIEIIPNWSTENHYNSVTNNEVSDGIFRIGYFGNIGIAQDFDTVKKLILSKRNDLTLEWNFAGHGGLFEDFKRFILENKIINVKVYDYLEESELNKLANICDAFLLSLKSELNGLAVPSKYYTYLNYRKPIIAIISNESDISKEINQYNLGVAIENDTKTDLIKIIKKLSISNRNINYVDIYNEFYESDVQLVKYSNMLHDLIVNTN